MGQKTAYLEAALLAQSFGQTPWTPPATWYVVLSTDPFDVNATGSGITEPGSNYGRFAVANTAAEWTAPSGSAPTVVSNINPWDFGQAAADWGSLHAAYLCDAAVGGNLCYGTDINGSAGAPVTAGSSFSVPVGAFLIRES